MGDFIPRELQTLSGEKQQVKGQGLSRQRSNSGTMVCSQTHWDDAKVGLTTGWKAEGVKIVLDFSGRRIFSGDRVQKTECVWGTPETFTVFMCKRQRRCWLSGVQFRIQFSACCWQFLLQTYVLIYVLFLRTGWQLECWEPGQACLGQDRSLTNAKIFFLFFLWVFLLNWYVC